MARSKRTSWKPGRCGTPDCQSERIEGRYVCDEHAKEMDRIRHELETDPLLLYNQRSSNKNRIITDNAQAKGKRPKKRPRAPVCCLVGCYEIRVPPSPYCDAHSDTAVDD